MPNWCDNSLTLRNSDKSKLDAIESVLSDKENQELFKHLRPYEGEWEYMWCCNNWGTKWESRIIDWERLAEDVIVIQFETAWGPPITLYDYLYGLDEGWDIEAYYYEPGMCFAGMYVEGVDNCYEYSDLTADEIEEELPQELDEMYSISQYRRDWEEENQEDEELSEEELLQRLDDLKKEFDKENNE